jgi:hypothetical protein
MLGMIIENNLPLSGILNWKQDGFVFLKVDDRFMNILYPKIQREGFEKPFSHMGAHITVIDPSLAKNAALPQEDLRNREFSFTITDCGIVNSHQKTFCVLGIESKGIVWIRKQCIANRSRSLPFRYRNIMSDHITIGVQKSKKTPAVVIHLKNPL